MRSQPEPLCDLGENDGDRAQVLTIELDYEAVRLRSDGGRIESCGLWDCALNCLGEQPTALLKKWLTTVRAGDLPASQCGSTT